MANPIITMEYKVAPLFPEKRSHRYALTAAMAHAMASLFPRIRTQSIFIRNAPSMAAGQSIANVQKLITGPTESERASKVGVWKSHCEYASARLQTPLRLASLDRSIEGLGYIDRSRAHNCGGVHLAIRGQIVGDRAKLPGLPVTNDDSAIKLFEFNLLQDALRVSKQRVKPRRPAYHHAGVIAGQQPCD